MLVLEAGTTEDEEEDEEGEDATLVEVDAGTAPPDTDAATSWFVVTPVRQKLDLIKLALVELAVPGLRVNTVKSFLQ